MAGLLLLAAPVQAAPPLPMPPTLCPTTDTTPTLTASGDPNVTGDQAYIVDTGSTGLVFETDLPSTGDSASVINGEAINSTNPVAAAITFYGEFDLVCYDGSAGASITSADIGIAVDELSDGDVLLYIAHALTSNSVGVQVTHDGDGLVDIAAGAITTFDAGILVARLGEGTTKILANGPIDSTGPGIVVFYDPGSSGDVEVETKGDVASEDSGIAIVHAGEVGGVSVTTAAGTTISARGGLGPPLSGGPAGIYVERSASGAPLSGGDIEIVNGADIDAEYAGILVDVCDCVQTAVSITSSGDITADDGAGIFVSHISDADVTIEQTGSITSANGGGVFVYKEGTGNIGITATGGIDAFVGAVYAFLDGPGNIGIDLAGTIVSHTGAPAVLGLGSGAAGITRIDSAADITSELGIVAGGADVRIGITGGTIRSEQAINAVGDTVALSIGSGAGIEVTSVSGIGVLIDALGATMEIAGSIDATGTDAIVFASGPGQLTLLPGFDIKGNVSAASATGDVLRFGGAGTEMFDLDRIGTQFTGFDSLVKTGSSDWSFTGSTFTGSLRAEDGIVRVNTALPGLDLQLTGSGILKGTGTIGSLTASGGSVAPGNSIGTLIVAGNVVMDAGSNYDVEVNATGGSDKVAAGGTATLSTTATVSVAMEPGTYGAVTQYTILSAAGGVAGTFDDDVNVTSAFFDGALTYDANNVYLTLTRNSLTLGDFTKTPNQTATAAALDAGGKGAPYFGQLLVLSGGQTPGALDAISGDGYASVTAAALDDGRFVRDAALDRRGTRGVWSTPYGGVSHLPGDGNGPAVDHATGGLLLGADSAMGDGWLGVLLGYGQSRYDIASRDMDARSSEITLGAYGGAQWDAFYASFGGAITGRDIDATRRVIFPGVSDTFTASYASATAQAFGELGYRIDMNGTTITPFGGLAGLMATTSGYTEGGTGAGALTVDPSVASALVATLGVRLEHEIALADDMTLTLRASAAWRHAFGGASTTNRAAGTSAFTVAGAPLPADTLAISAGTALDMGQVNLDLDYTGSLGSGGSASALTATLSGRF